MMKLGVGWVSLRILSTMFASEATLSRFRKTALDFERKMSLTVAK